MNDWDSGNEEEEDAEYDRQEIDREREEERYAKPAAPKKSWDKYTIESDESGDEAADIEDIADDTEVEKAKPKLKKGAKVAGKVPKKR